MVGDIEYRAVLGGRGRTVELRVSSVEERTLWVKPELDGDGEFHVSLDTFTMAAGQLLRLHPGDEG